MDTAGSSSAARKKRELTIEDKLKTCILVKSGRSLTSTAAEFNMAFIVLYYVC